MNKAKSYWVGRKQDVRYTCPNVSLFRLIASAIGSIEGKNVLEVGFGQGADLLECHRRKANVYGLDINTEFVNFIAHEHKLNVKIFDAASEYVPFDAEFDLIYSRDMVYYLSDLEIELFLENMYKSLKNEGVLILQFIEADLINKKIKAEKNNFSLDYLTSCEETKIGDIDNPIRYLSTDDLLRTAGEIGFRLLGKKIMIQSYDLNEEYIRVDRYLVLQK